MLPSATLSASRPAATRTGGTTRPTSAPSSIASPPTTSGSTRPTPRISTRSTTTVLEHESQAVLRPDRPDQDRLRGYAGRRLRVDLRTARRRNRSRPAHPAELPRTRSARAATRPRPTRSTIDNQITDKQIKVYVYNRQNATPDVQAQVDAAKASRDSGHHDHRDADAGRRDVPGMAGRATDRAARRAEAGDAADAAADELTAAARDSRTRPVVSVVDATVTLGGRTIWSNLTATVAAGEFVAVLGPNGVGKSTLLKAILGLTPLAAGHIEVLGRGRSAGAAEAACGNRDIGYLPQRRTFDASVRIRGRRRGAARHRRRPVGHSAARARGRGPPTAGSTSWSTWSARARTRTARSASSPAASSNGC